MNLGRPAGKTPPRYCLHKSSGNARVFIDGKTYWLGKHGTDESREKYRRLLAEKWNPTGSIRPVILEATPASVSVTRLIVEYVKHAANYYLKAGKATSEVAVVRRVMKALRETYGSLPASEFGPIKLDLFRQTFIDAGLSRSTINHYCWHVRKAFELGARREQIPLEWAQRLKVLGNLLQGRSEARETIEIGPIDDESVDATLKELTPTVAAMVRLQRLTGMRPGEVCQLRPADIDRSGSVWVYRPEVHKNQHKTSRRAKNRVVLIGPKSQFILKPYLLRDHLAYCFTPEEAVQQHQRSRKESRTTPTNQGNRAKECRVASYLVG